jgi:hypothetical protein
VIYLLWDDFWKEEGSSFYGAFYGAFSTPELAQSYADKLLADDKTQHAWLLAELEKNGDLASVQMVGKYVCYHEFVVRPYLIDSALGDQVEDQAPQSQ